MFLNTWGFNMSFEFGHTVFKTGLGGFAKMVQIILTLKDNSR